jgi:hypothetical protein
MKTHQKQFESEVRPVLRQLEAWRRKRKPKDRIPEALWQQMARLARVHGVSRVSQALRVAYYDLKKRAQSASCKPASKAEGFIEVPMPPAAVNPGFTVELEDGTAKMRLQLSPGSDTDALAWVQAFWRRERP